MFNKSIAAQKFFDTSTAESLADVLFEMGKGLAGKGQYHMANKWLERSYEVLNRQELDRLSMDASELRISIIEATVKSLLGSKETVAADKARNLVDLLENELGDKLVVLLLKLELLSSESTESFDGSSYYEVIQRMIRTMVSSEPNFKLVMFHIRKLNDKSPNLACNALDDLLRLRVNASGHEDWLEKVLITRIWMTVNQNESADTIGSLEHILTSISSNLSRPLGSTVSLAAHTVSLKPMFTIDTCIAKISASLEADGIKLHTKSV